MSGSRSGATSQHHNSPRAGLNDIRRPNRSLDEALRAEVEATDTRQTVNENLDRLTDLVDEHEGVVTTVNGISEEKIARLEAIATSCLVEYITDKNIELLDKCIAYKQQALKMSERLQLPLIEKLQSLGSVLYFRFDQLRNPSDIDDAIKHESRAVTLSSNNDTAHGACLDALGVSLRVRFEWLGDLEDLSNSIKCSVEAIEVTPDGDPEKPGRLNHLGIACQTRFKRLGEPEDLDRAIQYKSQAVDLTADGDSSKPLYLNNLGLSWQSRFERLGELADIDHAIRRKSQAVNLTPDGHLNKPSFLNNLGLSLRSRYEQLGELADIDRAISCQSQAVRLTSQNHSEKPRRLSNLGNSYQSRFRRRGDLVDLNHAIECQSQAVELTPDNHPHKPGCLTNLGISCRSRYEQSGELVDMDRAISHQSRAVNLIVDDHPDKPSYLNNLANSWLRRFEQQGELENIDRAIQCQSEAVKLTPDGHPDKPGRLNHLGNSLLARFHNLRQHPDLEKACDAFRTGATTSVFRPHFQMLCARSWANTSMLLNVSPLEAYRTAFGLLPRLVWVGQTIHHRYETMSTVRDLAAQAAVWAISTHRYELALEWLEQGRSVVWGQTLQLRTPFEALSLVDYELAQKLRAVASQLDAAGSNPDRRSQNIGIPNDLVSQAEDHHKLALTWDKLLEKIRLLPDFEDFMRPLKSKELKQASKNRSIVVINTHHKRCDALIILLGREDVLHVPLTEVRQEKLHHISTDVYCLRGQRGDSDDTRRVKWCRAEEKEPLLALIWSDIVEPVLNALGFMENAGRDELPHITWCTTGAMSFLPLHAAGLYDGRSPNAPDLVVSSYTPSLTALLLHKTLSPTQVGLLAIGQEASPGQRPLPYTVDELKVISKYNTVTPCHQLEGASATVAATLVAMEEHSWVHLACHAIQNPSFPSQSGFYLHDSILTLEEIARRQFKNKGLAFLSACQTAAGDHNLPDEATHLAAGMLMTGYPSVIATMWSIKDEDAPLVADIVYSELLKDGKLDHARSARALHKATKALREKVGEKEYWRWAPFIHVGV